MNIIFLDVDGVLNSERSCIAGQKRLIAYSHSEDDRPGTKFTKCTIDPIAVDLINHLCDEFDIKLVISSTHRKHFKDSPTKLQEMQKYFNDLGITGEVIGWTKSGTGKRGPEIADWLDNHPEVTKYLIVDDDSDMLDEQMPYFVHCNYLYGFSSKQYLQTKAFFSGEDSIVMSF